MLDFMKRVFRRKTVVSGLSKKAENYMLWHDLEVHQGRIRCAACGSNCGQCPTKFLGMTVDEFNQAYTKT